MIRHWIDFARRPEVRRRAVFLSEYDVLMAEHLVQGVDVWGNTPRRPWEASGTSGMKVLVNGGLNLSELDGWWAEAFPPDVGWAIGDGQEHGDDPSWDVAEAEALYGLLEREIVPEFYTRTANHGRLGLDLLNWQAALSKHWPVLRFGSAAVDQQEEQYFFQVQVYLDELDPEAVKVELYAEGQNGSAPIRQPMNRGGRLVGSTNGSCTA